MCISSKSGADIRRQGCFWPCFPRRESPGCAKATRTWATTVGRNYCGAFFSAVEDLSPDFFMATLEVIFGVQKSGSALIHSGCT